MLMTELDNNWSHVVVQPGTVPHTIQSHVEMSDAGQSTRATSVHAVNTPFWLRYNYHPTSPDWLFLYMHVSVCLSKMLLKTPQNERVAATVQFVRLRVRSLKSWSALTPNPTVIVGFAEEQRQKHQSERCCAKWRRLLWITAVWCSHRIKKTLWIHPKNVTRNKADRR